MTRLQVPQLLPASRSGVLATALGALLALVLTAAAPAAAGGPSPSQERIVSPGAAVPTDCSRDVTQELNEFFASLEDGASVRFPAAACYLTQGELLLQDKTGLVLDGNGATLRRTRITPAAMRYPNASAHVRLVRVRDSHLHGLRVEGTNTSSDLRYLRPDFGAYDVRFEFEHGFSFHGAEDVTLSDSSVDAVWGDGVNITGRDQYTGHGSRRVVVRDVSVDRNGRQGVTVIAHDVLLDGVRILHSRRSGVALEPNLAEAPVAGVEIRNSDISSWLLAFASGGRGAVDDVWIHDNVVRRSGVPFVHVRASDGARRKNWRVTGNSVAEQGSPVAAMRFTAVDGLVVEGNDVRIATTQSRLAVELQRTSGVQIRCNTFSGARPDFVLADTASTFVLEENAVGAAQPCVPAPNGADGPPDDGSAAQPLPSPGLP